MRCEGHLSHPALSESAGNKRGSLRWSPAFRPLARPWTFCVVCERQCLSSMSAVFVGRCINHGRKSAFGIAVLHAFALSLRSAALGWVASVSDFKDSTSLPLRSFLQVPDSVSAVRLRLVYNRALPGLPFHRSAKEISFGCALGKLPVSRINVTAFKSGTECCSGQHQCAIAHRCRPFLLQP